MTSPSFKLLRFFATLVFVVAGSAAMSSRNTVHGVSADTLAPDASVAYQINAQHNGDLPNDSLVAGRMAVTWQKDLGGSVSYPLVVGGSVYVIAAKPNFQGSQLYAFTLASGATLWGPIDLGGTWAGGGLTYDNGHVYALNSDGLLTSYNAATGASDNWNQATGSTLSPPTAYNGYVYVPNYSTVYQVTEATGHYAWNSSSGFGTPAVTDSSVIVGTSCGGAAKAINPVTGVVLWTNSGNCNLGAYFAPALFQAKVYLRENTGDGVVLNATNGSSVGSFVTTHAPAFDGVLGFYLDGSLLSATDLQTGQAQWTFTGDGHLSSPPIVVNGTVFVASSSGHLYGLNDLTGAVVSTKTLPAPFPEPSELTSTPTRGLGAGGGFLAVPSSNWLVVYSDSPLYLASSTNGTSTYGQPVTLTATVAPASATSHTAPTGTVSFYEDDLPPGGKLLGTVTLTANADGTASAALPPVTNLDVSGSPHHLYAVYSGDAANPAQQASITQSVSRASLAVTPDPVTCAFGTCQVWLGHLSGRVVGIQNNDPISVHYVTNATNSSPAGTYKITAQVTDGGTGRLSNYDVALSDGLMHVTLAGLKIQYKSPSSAKRGSRLVLKAVLQNALTRIPVAGRRLRVVIGSKAHAACTTIASNRSGLALCAIRKLNLAAGQQTVILRFAGDRKGKKYDYAPSVARQKLKVT